MDRDEILKQSIELAKEAVKPLQTLRENTTLQEYYRELHLFVDSKIAKANIEDKIQCNKQECSFCCHDKILGTYSEMVYVKNKAKELGVPINTSVKQREENWKSLSFKDKACPLLHNGKCTVYEFRPIICRIHNIALGEDINKCKRENEEVTNELIPIEAEILAISDIMLDGEIACLNFMLT